MRSGFVLIALLCVFTLIGAAMLMSDDNSRFNAPSAVRVGVETGRVNVKQGNEQISLKAGEESTSRQEQRIAVTAAPEPARPTNAVADLRKPENAITLPVTTPQTRDIDLTITDALGEAIPSGTVQAGSETIEFEEGKCRLRNVAREEMEIAVQAEGYQDLTQAITADETGRNIALEYLQTINIRVVTQNESTVPVAGVEVRLWKGMEVMRRPVGETIKAPFKQLRKSFYGTLQRESDRIVIADIVASDPNAYDAPHTGDRLVGMGYYTFNSNEKLQHPVNYIFLPLAQPDSIRLRMWDTLVLISERPTIPMFHGLNFEFDRRGERKVINLSGAPRIKNRVEVDRFVTNADGYCRFENLEPGLYMAQAFQGAKRSAIFDIYPIQGGANLWLDEANMAVFVERDGVNAARIDGIQNVQVTIQSVEGSSGIQAKGTDESGQTYFKSLTFGKYEITVDPPQESGLQTQKRIIDLVEPYHREYFTYEALPGLEFSGKVLRANTKEPVEGYTVSLRVEELLDKSKHGVYGIHDTQISDQEGSFHFTGVLPGKYTIDGPNLDNYKGFLPEGLCAIPKSLIWNTSHRIELSQSVQDYELMVLPGVETHFSGKVIKPDGSIVPGAELKISRTVQSTRNGQKKEGKRPFDLLGKFITDEKGEFDFYFITGLNNTIYKETLYAQLVEPFKSNKSMEMSMGSGSGSYGSSNSGVRWGFGSMGGPSGGPGNIRCQGEVPLEFHIGDTLLNINVVVQDVVSYVVEGIVSVEDGKLPEFISIPGSGIGMMGAGSDQMPFILSIGCFKDNQWYQGEIDPEGRYRIEFPAPGWCELQIPLNGHSKEVEGWGSRNFIQYCAEFHKVELSDTNRTVQLNIVLQRGHYLYGRIVDQDNKPVVDAEVWAKAGDEKNPTSHGYCRSNRLGNFSVAGLRRNQPHTLTVKFSFSKEDIVTIPNLMPVEEDSTQMIPIRINKVTSGE